MSNFEQNDYEPKRFGISYSPPQIVVEYNKPSKNKLYHHKIKIKNLTNDSKISDIVDDIYKKHGQYLNKTKKTANDYRKEFNLDENLNLLSKEELDKKKKKMDEYYEQNNIKVGDKNFKYDVRKDFDVGVYPADWDDDDFI